MERRKGFSNGASKGSRTAKGSATTSKPAGSKRTGGSARKRRSNLEKADTALGAPAEKRGLAAAPSGKGGGKAGAAKGRPPAGKVQKSGKVKKKTADAPDVGAGQRPLRVNVKTGRYRKHSSTLWLDRQLNDPYVARARVEGYRSRAAYKLIELNEKFDFLKPGARVVDLGCAPGGWCQAAVRADAGKVIGIDYLGMDTVAGADVLEMDFLDPGAPARLKAMLAGPADIVLSDMAAPTTGHKATDHLRIVALAEAALDFAEDVLAPGGVFVCKVFAGGAEGPMLTRLKQRFALVRHAKPKASRADSAEKYVVATGFRPETGGDPATENGARGE